MQNLMYEHGFSSSSSENENENENEIDRASESAKFYDLTFVSVCT